MTQDTSDKIIMTTVLLFCFFMLWGVTIQWPENDSNRARRDRVTEASETYPSLKTLCDVILLDGKVTDEEVNGLTEAIRGL